MCVMSCATSRSVLEEWRLLTGYTSKVWVPKLSFCISYIQASRDAKRIRVLKVSTSTTVENRNLVVRVVSASGALCEDLPELTIEYKKFYDCLLSLS